MKVFRSVQQSDSYETTASISKWVGIGNTMLVPIPSTLQVCNHNQYSLQIVLLGDHIDYNNEQAYSTQNIIISRII